MNRTTPNNEPHAGAAALRLVAMTLGSALALGAIGYYPTLAQVGPRGLTGLWLGLGTALVAGLAGLVPSLLSLSLGPRERMNAMLTGMALRFLLMLGLLLAVVLSGWADRVTLAIWAVIGYVVLLAVDTAGLAWLSKRAVRNPS